jgi:hypothetical protein
MPRKVITSFPPTGSYASLRIPPERARRLGELQRDRIVKKWHKSPSIVKLKKS